MSADHAAEILRLRSTVRDLLALSAIPEVWIGREPPAIAAELADLLIESLQLDFAFVRLSDPTGCHALDVMRGDSWKAFPEWLQQHLAVFSQVSRKEIVTKVSGGEESCCGIVIPIGVNGGRGLVAAACDRSDFPNQIDQQLLSVAANNAAIAFQNACLINELRSVQKALRDHEQELRKAHDELELKVAERTSELQRSAHELQRSEFYLAEGQHLGHTGSWAFNPSGFFEHWSRELFQIYGLEPQEEAPTLEQYLATIHPQDRDFMAETVKRMCEQGSGCDVKKRIIRPDGAVRYVRCVGIPVLDNGVLKRFLGTAMDVTEQEQLTQELQRREAYLAEAQRLSKTGSWAWSPDTDVRYWSEECYRVLGFDPRDGLPRMEELIQRIHPDDQLAFRQSTKRARHIRSDEGVNYRIVHPGGAVRDIYSIGHPVFSPSGDLIEYTGTVIDVTERKRAEQELQKLVDFVPQLIVVLESDGELIYANRVFREYTGLTLEELRSGDAVASLIHPDDLERMRAARKHGFAGNEPFELDARLFGKDGIHRWFLARYNPLVEEGRARRWYVSVTEIESRKQEEERVRKENVRLEERTRIAQELHDTLLQTFQSASLYLGAALYGVSQDSPVKPQLDRILQIMSQGIAEGRSAIQGLRSSGSQTSDLVVALSRIQEALEVPPEIDFRVIVTGRQRQLPRETQDEIYRIGRESLVNAFSHSGAKCVDLELEYSDSELQMRIRDNGCGIDPQVLEKGRDGHWGLAGMRERATRIGGRLRILSRATAGSEIQLSVPLERSFSHHGSE